MYIWIGCRLPQGFEAELRERCLRENESIGPNTQAFSLPQHVSLKISFPTDRAGAVLEFLGDYLAAQKAFSVTVESLGQIPGVLWLNVGENPVLEEMHRYLDESLLQRFGVAQHPYDREFRFHSTLFLDADGEKLSEMARRLRDYPLPQVLQVNTFLLGTSEDAASGSYQIVAQIPAKWGKLLVIPTQIWYDFTIREKWEGRGIW